MATKQPTLLSKNAYAKYLGVNEKAIRNAIASGKISKGWCVDNQKIKVKEADIEYGHLHKVATPKPGVSKTKRIEQLNTPEKSEKPAKKVRKSEPVKSENKKSEKSEEKPDSAYSFDHTNEFIDDTYRDFGDTYEELLLKIPVTSELPYNEAVRRREIIQLALEKKKLEELETVLVRRELVEKVLYSSALNLKKNLMMVAARVADDIITADNKVEVMNIINNEISSILAEYANVGEIDLTVKNK
jgi:hypothetical protein